MRWSCAFRLRRLAQSLRRVSDRVPRHFPVNSHKTALVGCPCAFRLLWADATAAAAARAALLSAPAGHNPCCHGCTLLLLFFWVAECFPALRGVTSCSGNLCAPDFFGILCCGDLWLHGLETPRSRVSLDSLAVPSCDEKRRPCLFHVEQTA